MLDGMDTCRSWPFPADMSYPDEIDGRQMDTYHRWMEVVIPIGLIGLPCLNIPVGFGSNGLPAGLQLFGARDQDAKLLQLGQIWHDATTFHRQRPAMLYDA